MDLADMLIVPYRSPMKIHGWYLKVLIHCVDIWEVNLLQLYLRSANQLSIPKRSQMAILKFSSKIADGLLYESKPVDRSVGRPPKRKALEDVTEGKRWRVVTPTSSNCSRTDETGYWPVYRDIVFHQWKKLLLRISLLLDYLNEKEWQKKDFLMLTIVTKICAFWK